MPILQRNARARLPKLICCQCCWPPMLWLQHSYATSLHFIYCFCALCMHMCVCVYFFDFLALITYQRECEVPEVTGIHKFYNRDYDFSTFLLLLLWRPQPAPSKCGSNGSGMHHWSVWLVPMIIGHLLLLLCYSPLTCSIDCNLFCCCALLLFYYLPTPCRRPQTHTHN